MEKNTRKAVTLGYVILGGRIIIIIDDIAGVITLTGFLKKGAKGGFKWIAKKLVERRTKRALAKDAAREIAARKAFVESLKKTMGEKAEQCFKKSGEILAKKKYRSKFITNNLDDYVDDALKEIFESIFKSGKIPKGWKAIKGGLTKVKINNKELLKKLKAIKPGKWKKVYKKGMVGNTKVEIHYFEHESGAVFDVKPKIK